LALLLFREAGSNVLEVTEEVQAAVQTIQAEQMESRELHIRVASDQTGYIYAALNLVQQNLLVGAMLAVVVLLVFLRRLGASAVVAIAIPVCAMGTALGMALMGRTINVVSMAGMAFAVGLVVDNAIVVLENIDTWRTRTRDTAEAAIEGTREVWGAILASTLTTAAVFIPILTWEDEVGQLLRDVSLAIATAVAISLVVSVLMIPSLAARLMSREKAQEEAQHTTPTSPSPIVRLAGGIRELIGTQVRWLVSSPLRSAAMALLAPALAIAVALALLPPAEYLPTGNRDLVFGIMIPPPGYSVHEMNAIGDTIQNKMLEHTGVEKDGVPEIARSFYVGDPNAAFMGAISQDPMRARELVPFMRSIFAQIPGVFGIATQASLFGRSVGGGRAVEINISGSDLAQMTALGGRMMGAVKGVIPNAQIRPIPSLDAGAPEFHVLPNRDQMAQQQLRGAELGLVVDALMDGAIIGEVGREGETKLDVIVKARNTQISDVADLRNAPVATPRGEVVPLETLATVSERLGPTVIRRLERRRSI
ncbi:MAG: efflux RND transporter permease subunit, partial [Myxococcota bacterium]